ncbi:enoyl-CoA hydratase/isomerase family protein [Fodinicola acaciae]|uniref:enoyl-CoA hydratase/isomerase family protein n=1 Tax=Fodinicola acaciae TaxID=2681555 RepID=UPI001C9E420E|nr:enoyl-CoA hydratase/isomerase family protein [Fodinicola acaciae]
MTPSIRREPAAGHVRITLDRPGRRNALDLATVDALIAAFDEDPAAIVVLDSADPRAFCAGADLGITDEERAQVSDRLYACYRTMVERPGPVVAVVDGPAVGGGTQLASAADLRVVGPNARFRWVGPGHGLAVGAWILPSLVGRSVAFELMWTGRWLEAAEAQRIGFALAVEHEELVEQLVSLDPAAMARTKAIVNSDGLLDRLRAERENNVASWAGSVAGLR